MFSLCVVQPNEVRGEREEEGEDKAKETIRYKKKMKAEYPESHVEMLAESQESHMEIVHTLPISFQTLLRGPQEQGERGDRKT